MRFFGKKKQVQEDEKLLYPLFNRVLNNKKLYNVLAANKYSGISTHFGKDMYKFYVDCSIDHARKHIDSNLVYGYHQHFWNEIHMSPKTYEKVFVKPVKWRFKDHFIDITDRYDEFLYSEQVVFREMFYHSFELMVEIIEHPEVEDETYNHMIRLCLEMRSFLRDRKLLTTQNFNSRIKQEIEDAKRIKKNIMTIN